MPGPTEVLNEDVRGLRTDIRKTWEILADLRARVDISNKAAVWGPTLVGGVAISGVIAGVWWGATITADVKNLDAQVNKRLDAAEAANRERFDRLEARIRSIKPDSTPKVP